MNDVPAPTRPALAVAPGGLPLLGHALPFIRRPLQFMSSLSACGDIVELRFGPKKNYLVCNRDLVHQVLMNPRTFDKGGALYEKPRLLLGNGLVTSGWKDHRSQRRLLQPMFHPRKIEDYAAMMAEEIDSFTASWQPGSVVDVTDAMHSLSAHMSIRTLFANHVSEEGTAELLHWLPVFLQGVYERAFMPLAFLEKLPTPKNRRFELSVVRLRQLIEDSIRQARQSDANEHSLVSLILDASDAKTQERLNDDEIRGQVENLLFASAATNGSALAWCFHLLGQHPEIDEQLHDEAEQVLHGEQPGFRHLPQLGLTQRVFAETLRLYPPGWIFSRITTEEVDLGGTRLPAGSTVLYSPYVLHHDATLFPSPEIFDPNRWLPEQRKLIPDHAWIPFAAGNRKCIGDGFATAESVLTIARIASRWRLRAVPGSTIRPQAHVTLSPGPVRMTVECRPSKR